MNGMFKRHLFQQVWFGGLNINNAKKIFLTIFAVMIFLLYMHTDIPSLTTHTQ